MSLVFGDNCMRVLSKWLLSGQTSRLWLRKCISKWVPDQLVSVLAIDNSRNRSKLKKTPQVTEMQ